MQPTADPATATLTGADIDITPGMVLPLPDDAAAAAARERLASIDIGISAPTVTALGMLSEAVVYIAAVQGSAYPRPLLSTRVVLLTGGHAGGVVAGPTPDPRNGLPLQHLAINAGAGVVTLEWQPASAAIELEDAITAEQMESALRAGWAEADRAADEGIELLVLAAGGPGASTAAAAVVAAVTGAEPTALLGRVVTPAGFFDDNAWMTRCLALRDALYRVRDRNGDPRTVLAALGGADIAAATGLILGAASRRMPVMIDGPVGAAAALVANDFSTQSRRWVVLPDTGRHMAVRFAAEALELRPWLDLCLDLGEGAAALAALPLLQTALTLAGVGEPVEPMPLTKLDSTGNQVFVGVARAIDPAGSDDEIVDGQVVGEIAHDDADGVSKTDGATEDSGQKPAKHAKAVPAKAGPRTDPTPAVDAGKDADKDAAAKDGSGKDAGGRSTTRPIGSRLKPPAEPTAILTTQPGPPNQRVSRPTGAGARAASAKTAQHKQVPGKSSPRSSTKSAATRAAKTAPAKASATKDAEVKDAEVEAKATTADTEKPAEITTPAATATATAAEASTEASTEPAAGTAPEQAPVVDKSSSNGGGPEEELPSERPEQVEAGVAAGSSSQPSAPKPRKRN